MVVRVGSHNRRQEVGGNLLPPPKELLGKLILDTFKTLGASKQRGTDTVPHEAESMRQDLAGNAIDNAE